MPTLTVGLAASLTSYRDDPPSASMLPVTVSELGFGVGNVTENTVAPLKRASRPRRVGRGDEHDA